MPTRRKLFAGNWKLHKTIPEAIALVQELSRLVARIRDCDIAVLPTYTALWAVHEKLGTMALGAQEIFYEDKGAFTGAVSGAMLKDAGCTYVLVGHSERRQHFGETLASSHKRVQAALRAGLTPILCVGETLVERQAQRTTQIVLEQFDAATAGLSEADLARLVLAYEPVWAIGTGVVATPQQAQEVHALLRERVWAKSPSVGSAMQILYGGSVKPENAKEILQQRDIDGALVGGASLEAQSFLGIIEARPR